MTVHRAPILPGGVTPCCGKAPAALGEYRHAFTWHRSEVTCRGRRAVRVPWGMLTVVLAFGWVLAESSPHPGLWAVAVGFGCLASFVAYAATRRR